MNERQLRKQVRVNWEKYEMGEISRAEYNRRNDLVWGAFCRYAFCRGRGG